MASRHEIRAATAFTMPDNHPTRRHSRFLAGAALAGALMLLAGVMFSLWHFLFHDEPADEPLPVREPHTTDFDRENRAADLEGFAASQACRECHRDIWERYQTHPMAHSMARATETAPPEDYEHGTVFTAGRNQYRVERTPTGVMHHEIAVDSAGQTIYDQPVEMHYAVGSGKRGRSYIADRGGMLFMSPISWYSEQGQAKWDLSPSYPVAGHMRFERRIINLCVSCHVGLANPLAGAVDRFQQPPFRELSIGCERCHGPGKEHAQLHQNMSAEGRADPIVNPAKLDSSRRDAVCYQCHLQGQERVLRYARTDFDFRPGMHVGDVWAIVLEGTGVADDDSTKSVSQVEQMISSRCYRESEGKLGCISCHDPHATVSDGKRVEHYRYKCLACHTEQGCAEPENIRRETSAADSCVDCHMPRLGANDVPHTSQTDHSIVRRKDSPRKQDREIVAVDAPHIFDADVVQFPRFEQERARGLLLSKLAERRQSPTLAAEVERVLTPGSLAFPADLPVLDALALAATLQRRSREATAHWNAILAVSPDDETALNSLALQAIAAGRQADALLYVERYLKVNPWNVRMHRHRSRLLAGLGREQEAIDAAKRAIELDPSHPETYHWLADLCARAGEAEESHRNDALYRRFSQSSDR